MHPLIADAVVTEMVAERHRFAARARRAAASVRPRPARRTRRARRAPTRRFVRAA
jgi:hypothetical protein